MEKRRCKRGVVLLVAGLILILTAIGWIVFNVMEDSQAGKQAKVLLEHFNEEIEKPTMQEVDSKSPFCGKVIIEKLGVELPVFEEWDYKKLKEAPCRYTGNITSNNMVIAAHNYQSHFGNLKSLKIGDEIIFTDVIKQNHIFQVKDMILLDGSAISDMQAGNWDLTLFTCTKGGRQRVTVRCERVE